METDRQVGRKYEGQKKTEGAGTEGHEGLFVVRVSESCCEPLADRGTVDYVSPPQPLDAARSLVALVAGRNHLEEIAPGDYSVAVAGGRRTISLEAVR
jgi:hypothetical protein